MFPDTMSKNESGHQPTIGTHFFANHFSDAPPPL
jgi:hypothetical protein